MSRGFVTFRHQVVREIGLVRMVKMDGKGAAGLERSEY